ncbi:MAG: hypothetical protein RJQ21_17845 [Rhodospirillales bacterium]
MSIVFRSKKELARYISEAERLGDGHAAITAFVANPGEDHLSVNYLELEGVDEISRYYGIVLQKNNNEVAICTHKVERYVSCGRGVNVKIEYKKNMDWEVHGAGSIYPAFKHRPVAAVPSKGRPKSSSHCGVEFVCEMDELAKQNFARKLAKKPKFHKIIL